MILICFICFCNISRAQPYKLLNSFSTTDGLPSNHVYDFAEDNKGFLWITTDNGVSRFDGKYFTNFSVKDGLPTNDVLQIVVENDGSIWVNCYKQPPAYFDEINNRFISVTDNDTITQISGVLLLITKMPNGGIRFFNKKGSVTFLHKKLVYAELTKADKITSDMIMENGDRLGLYNPRKMLHGRSVFTNYLLFKNDKIIDSNWLTIANSWGRSVIDENRLYLFLNDNSILRVSDIHTNPLRYTTDSAKIPKLVSGYKFSDKQLCVISHDGTVFIYNKKNLVLDHTVQGNTSINSAYIDKHGSLWLGTLDKGMLYFSNNGVNSYNIPPNLINPNFLSISVNKNGQLFAGNYYSQVLQINGGSYKKYNIPGKTKAHWLRRLIYAGQKLVTVYDEAVSIGFDKNIRLYNRNQTPTSLKTGIKLNDSTVILGTIFGLIQLHVNTLSTKALNSSPERILSLVKASEQVIYYIGPDGLYKYDCRKDTARFISLKNKRPGDQLSIIAIDQNSNLWISTSGGNLLIVKNDNLLTTIANNKGLPDNITCMYAYKNSIFAGSKTGICKIEYAYAGDQLRYSISNISNVDGLPSNTVNDLAFYNDTVYAATEKGIAFFPVNYKNHAVEITPLLSAVTINLQTVPIAFEYNLQSTQNNISLEFSGVDLTGHFKNIMYAVDNKVSFLNLSGNILNLHLNSGEHNVYIKALDVNNKQGKTALEIRINIKTPFYKAFWFWVAASFLGTAFSFWFYNRQKTNRQKAKFNRQLDLEQQRNKITADLHDNIGASLSSLQVNSSIANQLIDKDANLAKPVLKKIENQAKNLADTIGDIIWSMKPGKDEFMTMSSRIKNFANDILGATDIDYEIKIDNRMDTLINDITIRKNIVFIAREAINNAVKYSKASKITISVQIQKQQLALLIGDNGVGFDVKYARGNGIVNMKKRAEELKADFQIKTTLQQGTEISILIPIPEFNDTP